MANSQWTLPEQFDEYRIVRMLGRGSMGVVFLGHDLVLDRPVAIKFLNVVDASPRARERFLTEARAAIDATNQKAVAAMLAGDAVTASAHYANDAVVMMPGMTRMTGHAEIEVFSDEGIKMGEGKASFAGEAPGTAPVERHGRDDALLRAGTG